MPAVLLMPEMAIETFALFCVLRGKKNRPLMMNQYTLDARNTLCPMPVIKTQNRIAELKPGDELEVICTDPGALNDIPAWCRINGHQVLESRDEGNEQIIVVRVGGTE